jgi:uncharacterized protein involved in exopolysaccharide biosynthesis
MSKNSDDKFVITLSDLFSLLRKSKWKIIFCMLAVSLIGALFALDKPIKYKAEATFRDKGIKSSYGSGGIIAQMLEGGKLSSDSEAMSLLKSKKVMKAAIEKLNLQGHIMPVCAREGFLARAQNNLKAEWAAWRNATLPPLKDLHCPLKIEAISYKGEIPLGFTIKPVEGKNNYQIIDASQQLFGEGYFNQPFIGDGIAFTLRTEESNVDQPFDLVISPWTDVAKKMQKDFELENDKMTKGVLKLSYWHRDRHFASQVVNTIMDVYQTYLEQEHAQIATSQLGYLSKRQNETLDNLKHLMENHADFLSKDLFSAGFADSRMEMDFLARRQQELKETMLSNNLEIKRLKNMQSNLTYYNRYTQKDEGIQVVNQILLQLRELRQERDSLELALKKNSKSAGINFQAAFNQQFDELRQIQQYNADVHAIMQDLQAGLLPSSALAIFKDPHFIIKDWFDRLTTIEQVDEDEKNKIKLSFISYLENLQNLFNVYERTLQERLTHQQNPSNEYQGINLETANNLYIDYCRNLSAEEGFIRQMTFVLNQMQDPHFEITSLSALLTDSVSNEMITRASQLILQLKDENNQSPREQERLKTDLHLQKTFLTIHLEQMIKLKELGKELLEEKIYVLQSLSLELIHQRVFLLERNFQEFVQTRLENLEQEKAIIQEHLASIHQEMSRLPQKMMAERLIEQQLEVSQSIVSEVAKVVESKNLSHNLDLIQSSPIDISTPPLHAQKPGVLLYALLGAALGGLLGTGFIFARSISSGLRASEESLKVLSQHVSGYLSSAYDADSTKPLVEQDLSTLRRLHTYFDSSNSALKSILLIQGKGPNYAIDLGTLFSKKGHKTLILDLDQAGPHPGLLQYLQKEIPSLPISTCACGDYLSAGANSRFSLELLTSRAFQEVLEQLKGRYDWIIAASQALPLSSEAESLAHLFPYIAVTVDNESVEELGFYTELNQEKKVSFILLDTLHR